MKYMLEIMESENPEAAQFGDFKILLTKLPSTKNA
jgi:hypothetical protein